MSTVRTTRPRSAAIAFHGPTLPSWSRIVTTISSPGAIVAPIERLMWNVSDVMFAPNLISSAEAAPSRSAIAWWASWTRCVAPPARQERAVVVRVRGPVVVADRGDHRLRDLGPARPVEEGDRPAAVLDREGRELAPQRLDVERGHGRIPLGDGRMDGTAARRGASKTADPWGPP